MARHTFQSFWWGDALSPYEVLCLKSFIACGYGSLRDRAHPSTQQPLPVPVRQKMEALPRSLSRECRLDFAVLTDGQMPVSRPNKEVFPRHHTRT